MGGFIVQFIRSILPRTVQDSYGVYGLAFCCQLAPSSPNPTLVACVTPFAICTMARAARRLAMLADGLGNPRERKSPIKKFPYEEGRKMEVGNGRKYVRGKEPRETSATASTSVAIALPILGQQSIHWRAMLPKLQASPPILSIIGRPNELRSLRHFASLMSSNRTWQQPR